MSQLNAKSKWHLYAVIALAFAFFLVGLDRLPVPTVDGAVRAAMARNILRTGQWFPPIYEDRTLIDHPPLFIWLTALSLKLFGFHDFAINLVPRIFAALTVILVYLIAIEAEFSAATALSASLVLCLTRDFVLSSVRGYIEPLLEATMYAALFFVLKQKKTRSAWPSFAAGISLALCFFSKGPVALWPLLFLTTLLCWNTSTQQRRRYTLGTLISGLTICGTAWALWVTSKNQWNEWSQYLHHQILSSAIDGRGGAQSLEPLYFIRILTKTYWPWLPLLLIALFHTVRKTLSLQFSRRNSYGILFFIFGAGFVISFSLMRWKFWYYIAPAYPAFSLFLAVSFERAIEKRFESPVLAKVICGIALVWTIVAHVFSIPLHRERVPEIAAFKKHVLESNVPGPIYFTKSSRDHNLIATSGNWYFDRTVVKLEGESEAYLDSLKADAWIITDRNTVVNCAQTWCKRGKIVAEASPSVLFRLKTAE